MAFNPMDFSAKDTILDVVRTERANFFRIVDDPANWNVQTRCTEWEVRDIVGHMIDVTEGYLSRWEVARKGEAADAVGLQVMGERLNDRALSFRSLSREEAIRRLKADSDQMLAIFDALTADEWGGFLVTHPYMGQLPTCFYPAFHVMDYGVHTWDMKWGLGDKDGKLNERTAGVIVPYMFILMQYTVDQEVARDKAFAFDVKVDGPWGGQWHVNVADGQYTYASAEQLEPGGVLFHFKDASDFVLTSFQRFPGGETSGDPQVVATVRHMFFRV